MGAGTCESLQALPPALNPKEDKKKADVKEQEHATAVAIGDLVQTGGMEHITPEVNITPDSVLQRLGLIKPFGSTPMSGIGPVGIRSMNFLQTAGSASDLSGSPAAAPAAGANTAAAGGGPEGAGAKASTGGGPEGADRRKQLHTARLLRLELKGASGVVATIEYGGTEYEVDSDLLLKCESDEPAVPPVVEQKQDLPEVSWDSMAVDLSRNVALWALGQAFVQTFEAVGGVAIEQIGPLDAAPFKVRARATQGFAPGELVLVPHLGSFAQALLLHSTSTLCEKYEQVDKQEMDASSIPRAYLRVVSVETKAKRGAKAEASGDWPPMKDTFYANSPLFKTRKSLKERNPNTANMSPFWAVGTSASRKDVNMKLEPFGFAANPAKIIAASMPSPLKGPMYSVFVQVAVNVKKVAKGDYLFASVMRDDLGPPEEEVAD